MTNPFPLVTIIIPTYNRAQLVVHAVESALNQTYPNKEIVVVDDGSTDGTREVIAAFPEVTYIWKKNGRQASARNTGLVVSRGKYITTLDSDDVWQPDFLEESINKMEADQLDFVFSNWESTNAKGERYSEMANKKSLYTYFHEVPHSENNWVNLPYNDLRRLFLNGCLAPSSALVFRKSSLVAPWNESIRVADDWEFQIGLIVSKPLKVAFNKDIKWTKNTVGDNVFESLDYSQMVDIVMIRDLNLILSLHQDKYTEAEKTQIIHTQASYCFWSAYFQLKRGNIFKVVQLLMYSYRLDSSITREKLFRVYNLIFLYRSLKRGLKRLVK
jgi:glycosyltransferase involved in cell wall biosynthesis